jgi:hypothetical protein
VVDPGDTFIEDPVPTNDPPQLPEYQFQEAPVPREPPATLNVVVPPPQRGLGLAEADEGAVDGVLTVTVAEAHPVVLQFPTALTK